MKTKYLLPNYYKRLGAIMVPFGLLTWYLTQIGLFNKLLTVHWAVIMVLVISFFSFLTGIYFLVFTREKQEDEYIINLRLQSFQLAAFIQLFFFLLTFLGMFIFSIEFNHDAGLASFFVSSVLLFWFFYIFHFNYIIYRNKSKTENI